jgi:terminase small subunit / prophage DNA-packing protein
MDMDKPCTQKEFGKLVGISQQAVSNLVARGVLLPGQTAQHWLDRYLSHLRSAIIDRLQGRI